MPEPPPATAPARLQLTLERGTGTSAWQVELHNPGGPQRFDSLAALQAWLDTLVAPPHPAPPARGIR